MAHPPNLPIKKTQKSIQIAESALTSFRGRMQGIGVWFIRTAGFIQLAADKQTMPNLFDKSDNEDIVQARSMISIIRLNCTEITLRLDSV